MKKFLMVSAAVYVMTVAAPAADVAPTPVMAPADWFVHAGVTGVFFNSGLDSITVTGVPVVSVANGAGAHVTNNVTGTLEIGRYLNPNFSVSLAAGIPPTNDVIGDGQLAAQGRLGSATYGSVFFWWTISLQRWRAVPPLRWRRLGI